MITDLFLTNSNLDSITMTEADRAAQKSDAEESLIRLDLTAQADQIDALTGILVRQISYGWEEENLDNGGMHFTVYCENPELAERLLAEISARVPEIRTERSVAERKNWVLAWREFFTPVTVGRFLIMPPWLVQSTAQAKHLPIIIEPKSAFGTGHHASTTLCLQALEMLCNPTLIPKSRLLRPGMRFFDLGTGTGILGIACTLLGLSGIGADLDPVAIDNALENIQINRAHDFTVHVGSTEIGREEQFDLVMANILANPLCEMAADILAKVRKDGHLVLSGILDIQADTVQHAYASLGQAKRIHDGEWTALIW